MQHASYRTSPQGQASKIRQWELDLESDEALRRLANLKSRDIRQRTHLNTGRLGSLSLLPAVPHDEAPATDAAVPEDWQSSFVSSLFAANERLQAEPSYAPPLLDDSHSTYLTALPHLSYSQSTLPPLPPTPERALPRQRELTHVRSAPVALPTAAPRRTLLPLSPEKGSRRCVHPFF
eukprot:4862761-Pleurochrysis_carterae.AAC.2